jgi:HEAT repeat protein
VGGKDTAAAIPGLVAALHDEEPRVRRRAAVALGSLRGRETAPRLAEALDDEDAEMRVTAAAALWRLGGRREALAVLTLALRDPDERIVLHAVEILADHGPDAGLALPELRKLLVVKDPWLRANVALAAWRLQRREEVDDVIHDPRQEVVPELLAMLGGGDADTQLCALRVLEKIGPEGRGVLPALVGSLKDEQAWNRVRTARALGRMGPAAVEPLTSALEDADREVRIVSAASLVRLGKPSRQVVTVLTEALARDPESAWSLAPLLAECGAEAKPAVPVLLRCLLHEDRGVYLAAARALPRIDPEAARRAGLP